MEKDKIGESLADMNQHIISPKANGLPLQISLWSFTFMDMIDEWVPDLEVSMALQDKALYRKIK